jgi:ABC-type transport system involved in multi-copper enzyme maturation permease subunit
MRKRQLLILTIVYALFTWYHLCIAVGCKLTTALLFAVPSFCFVCALLSFVMNKWTRPTVMERFCTICFVSHIAFFNVYLVLATYSQPLWVWYNNTKSGIFIAITIIFYSITYYKFKREQRQ